ncbi:MAG: YCF48-related protein [Egibacteraceae bacterium]
MYNKIVSKGNPSMNRFQRVIEILDTAIGGPSAKIGFHGAFWRVPRDQFVEVKVFGADDLPLVVVGDGSASNLVQALRGEGRFDGSEFPRMPVGGEVPPEEIAFIEQWIDDGCPEDSLEPASTAKLMWRPVNTGETGEISRYDDIWFLNPKVGWAVNSAAKVFRTTDGGITWSSTRIPSAVYLRCVGFASESRGWVGGTTPPRQLFETRDGGVTWNRVELPEEAPKMVCGLSVVNGDVVYASGTNHNFEHPGVSNRDPRMMRTVDGGQSWQAWEMKAHASLLVDTYFVTPERGWVVGGKGHPHAGPAPSPSERPGCHPGWAERWNIKPVVLFTEDGGKNWINKVAGLQEEFPLGEWGWKIQFLNDRVGFVALENFFAGAILKTTDGGETWERFEITDPQGNANLEGVGFVDENLGWVGGWGSCNLQAGFSSATSDGGRTWIDANEIGRKINRFRFFGDPVTVGYACGQTVYKYSAEPMPSPLMTAAPAVGLLEREEPSGIAGPVRIEINVPVDASYLVIDIYDPQFGDHVRTLVDEAQPASGSRTVEWDLTDDAGRPSGPGNFVIRVTVDDQSESQLMWG